MRRGGAVTDVSVPNTPVSHVLSLPVRRICLSEGQCREKIAIVLSCPRHVPPAQRETESLNYFGCLVVVLFKSFHLNMYFFFL